MVSKQIKICAKFNRRIQVQQKDTEAANFFKTGVLKSFANFTGKHLCWSLFLIKVAGLRSVTLLKRDSNTCFPVKFAKILRTHFFKEDLRWMLIQNWYYMITTLKSLPLTLNMLQAHLGFYRTCLMENVFVKWLHLKGIKGISEWLHFLSI